MSLGAGGTAVKVGLGLWRMARQKKPFAAFGTASIIGAMPSRAVFMDLSGTISDEVGHLNHLSRFRLLPGAVEAVRLVNASGWKAVLATNQSGVARGYFPLSLLDEVYGELGRRLAAGGAWLDRVYHCPHHPTEGAPLYRCECDCRKPRPGMLKQAAQELDLDLGRSFVVGDKITDVEAGHRAGARGVLVLTGYGRGEVEYTRASWSTEPDHIAEDLLAAVRWILEEGKRD